MNAAVGTQAPLTVATYAYPGLDRVSAVAPLQAWLQEETQRPVIVRVAETPAELAAWVEQEAVDLAMPNLAAYLKIRQQNSDVKFMAVPKRHSPLVNKAQYRGSIAANGFSSLPEIINHLNQGQTITVFAVFPDSTTGSLIGLSKLRTLLSTEQFKQLQLVYTGSHEQVLKQLNSHQFSLGILAANAFDRAISNVKLTELWRSDEVPFGPITCIPKQLACDTLKLALSRNLLTNQQILEGLKRGWPEFEDTEVLSFQEDNIYTDLIREQLVINQTERDESKK